MPLCFTQSAVTDGEFDLRRGGGQGWGSLVKQASGVRVEAYILEGTKLVRDRNGSKNVKSIRNRKTWTNTNVCKK